MKERKLGRGISDLISENELSFNDEEKVIEIDIDSVFPNPEQPRTDFNKEALTELADSIKQHGILQPIIVKPSGDHYVLIAGERRLRAAKLADLETIPALVRE